MVYAIFSISLVLASANAQQAEAPCAQETQNTLHQIKIAAISLINTLQKPEIKEYRITVRREGSNLGYIEGANTAEFFQKHPYTRFLPEPFFYHEDVAEAQRTGKKAFLIAGVNCDSTLSDITTITGPSLETLSLRGRGNVNREQYFGLFTDIRERPEWNDIGQVGYRSSGEGFLSRKFVYVKGEDQEHREKAGGELRRLLLEDNKAVRQLGQTHQTIAEPLLRGIEQKILKGAAIFEFNGEKFEITEDEMGGEIDGFEKPSPKIHSGWTGRGVQGSIFNDELFSNKVYKFRRMASKPGKPTTFEIDGLTPHLIYRYGFYQGGDFRKSPKEILDFFSLPKRPSELTWLKCN